MAATFQLARAPMRFVLVASVLLWVAPLTRSPVRAACPPSGGHRDRTGSMSFDSTEVDRDAVALTTQVPSLWPGHPAEAVARFVIDTTGRADLRTLSIEAGSDSALGAAVRRFMPQARFEPAELGGCRVRVWARWPFAETAAPVPVIRRA